MAKSEQVNIDLTATDKASKVIGDVADDVKALEKSDVDIPITADADQAQREIDAVGDDVRALSRVDADIVLRAKVDAARADLATLQAELRQTGDRADDTARQLDRVGGGGTDGIKTRGNAIADLTGPLGDASGAASDFAGVFDGLGDIAEDVAGKLGASTSTAAAVSSALGGLGIAVAAGAALWSYWSGKQKEAAERAEKTRDAAVKLNEALRAGNVEQFADQLVAQFGDVFDAARKAGLSVGEVTDYITGQTDVMPSLNAQLDAYKTKLQEQYQATGQQSDATREQYNELVSLQQAIYDAQAAYDAGSISADEYQAIVDEVTGTVRRNTAATDESSEAIGRNKSKLDSLRQGLDNIRNGLDMQQALLTFQSAVDEAMATVGSGAELTAEDVLGIKQSILDVATAAKATPIEVKAAMDKIDQGDLAGAKADAEAWFQRHPVNITAAIRPTSTGTGPGGGGGVPLGLAAPVPATTSVINVTQYLPRGFRGDALTSARHAARRSGGLYQRFSR